MNNTLNIIMNHGAKTAVSTLQASILEQQLFYIEQQQTQLPLQGIFCLLRWFLDAIFLHDSILMVSLSKRQQQQGGEMKIICRKKHPLLVMHYECITLRV